ncbi:unnamed protein product [Hermetia illucens]|uniref:Uncharacterized protein n=2 Tax=Hermetia illucens TaxID=343691 RepID=A0A7R8UYC5_HERIL|nr:unnamed protein product [Hermetia illucens]
MKVAVVILAILVEALASPLSEAPLVVDSILESTTPLPAALPISNLPSQYSNIRDDLGQYALSYLADRISHVEQGSLKEVNGAVVLVKRGSYVFIDKDGKRYLTSYIADENGFRPVGDHIPIIEA